MFRFYEFVNNHLSIRKFEVEELLFTAYDCPIEVERLDYWTQKNYFAYTVHGHLKWKNLDREIHAEAGEAVFVKKGAHRIFKVSDADFCALLIFMPDEFIKTVIRKYGLGNQHNLHESATEAIIPLEVDDVLSVYFDSVLNYFSHTAPPPKSLLKIRFEELIINILTRSAHQPLVSYFREICSGRKRPLKSVMEANFIYNLKMAEFAQLCGRSVASFKRDFAKTYHTSPGKWLKKRRLEYGKFLLETTDLNINEITSEAGFENPSHFIKSFKEMYKYPPLHFKKKLAIK
jgi:AraC-like DNA-binding protein